MPSKGTTKRGIRIDDELWADFQAATREAGTNPSETVRQLIRDWTNTHKQRGMGMSDTKQPTHADWERFKRARDADAIHAALLLAKYNEPERAKEYAARAVEADDRMAAISAILDGDGAK